MNDCLFFFTISADVSFSYTKAKFVCHYSYPGLSIDAYGIFLPYGLFQLLGFKKKTRSELDLRLSANLL